MDHQDHIALLRDAVGGGTWADVGSGTGAFTLALAELVGATGRIWSVDRDAEALGEQARLLRHRFPSMGVDFIVADFTRPLDLPPLDGLVMANALHFVRDKLPLLERLTGHLRDDGRFVLIEYDTDHGNPWVPYPLSFESWQTLAKQVGLRDTRRLAWRPSRFLRSIYSALSVAPLPTGGTCADMGVGPRRPA